jgi:hypothetical protein
LVSKSVLTVVYRERDYLRLVSDFI